MKEIVFKHTACVLSHHETHTETVVTALHACVNCRRFKRSECDHHRRLRELKDSKNYFSISDRTRMCDSHMATSPNIETIQNTCTVISPTPSAANGKCVVSVFFHFARFSVRNVFFFFFEGLAYGLRNLTQKLSSMMSLDSIAKLWLHHLLKLMTNFFKRKNIPGIFAWRNLPPALL